jgi:hypothetical protein
MLKQLVELARAKKQVNIALTHLAEDRFLLGIAPQGAGTDKIAPFLAKGTVAEIETQLAGLDAYITAALAKKPEPVKAADPDEDEDTETDTTDTTDGERESLPEAPAKIEPAPPAVEPAPATPAVPKQPTFNFNR